MLDETVLLGSKDSIDIVVTDNVGVPLNFITDLAVTEMIVFIDGNKVSSIGKPESVTFDDGGKVSLVLGGEDLNQGTWLSVAVTYYNGDYPNDGSPESGQTFIHPQRQHANMRVRAYPSQLGYIAP